MPYAIMRFKKTGTGGIAPAQKHNEREKTKYKSNPDIDAARISGTFSIQSFNAMLSYFSTWLLIRGERPLNVTCVCKRYGL